MTITFLFYNLEFIHLSSCILKSCLLLQPVGDYLAFISVHFFSVFCDCPFSNSILPHRSPFLSLLFSLLLQTAHLFLSVPLSSLFLTLSPPSFHSQILLFLHYPTPNSLPHTLANSWGALSKKSFIFIPVSLCR